VAFQALPFGLIALIWLELAPVGEVHVPLLAWTGAALGLLGARSAELKRLFLVARAACAMLLVRFLLPVPGSLDVVRASLLLDAFCVTPSARGFIGVGVVWVMLTADVLFLAFILDAADLLRIELLAPGGASLAAVAAAAAHVARLEGEHRASELLSDRNAALSKLAEANVSLQNYAVRAHSMAAARERSRIAREMHDTLGHSLTSILVVAKAGRKIVTSDEEQVSRDLAAIEEAASAGIQEMRRAVAALRTTEEEEESANNLWTKVGAVFEQTTGIHVTFDIQEEFGGVSSETKYTVYRVIQECLTNACRHGQARRVDVAVWRRNGTLLVRISDNGRGTSSVDEGNGLRGVRERVEALGGKVAYRFARGCGFDVGIELPDSSTGGGT
jgi:signal transduction histidine kinase